MKTSVILCLNVRTRKRSPVMESILLILVVILLSSVTGIQFQLSPNNINLENPLSNFVDLTCSMTETSVRVVTFIKIHKESNSGSSWDQIASIAGSENASFSSSLSNDFRSIMQVSGRLVSNPATDSRLVVSMNASLITCLHARKYRCELNYLVGDEFTSVDEAENATLQATASPSTPYIETVKNLNTSQVINVAQGDTSALSIQVDDQLEIVCKADLGTNQNTTIQWNYNSASGSWMIGYNGYRVNGEPVANAGAATSCRYTRTSTMRYNILDIDSARSSSNPLIFSCYIQSGGITTQNNPMYTFTISGSLKCKNIVCQNGGTCMERVDGFTCNCIQGFTGILCEKVTGIQFQLSENNINLENPLSNFVDLTCSMTETSVRVVTFIRIYKESNSGSSWDQIAAIAGSENAWLSPSLSNDFRSIMQVSGRLVNNPATDSRLVVSMNASLITCLHARKYRCELNYLVGDEFTSVDEAENATLQATASPSTPYIETVKNLNTSQVINVAQGDTSALSIQVDDQLEIVCKADLGTNQNTIIQWSYNSASGSGMIGYNGYRVNDEPVANTGAATSCRYTRTSTMRYNISDIDSARSSSNPLIFSCYIQSGGITTQNNPMYTVTISGSLKCKNIVCQNGGTCMERVDGFTCNCIQGFTGILCETAETKHNTENTLNTTTIVLSVLGFTLAVIVVNIVIWFCVWKRREKRRKENSAPKELVHVEQRDNRLTYQQSHVDEDEDQNYTNLYNTIPDAYMDIASAKEERNVEGECHTINDKDGKSHKPVFDADGITVTKRGDGYLSFSRRKAETPYYENQVFN
ncbi:hypothetical protein ACF0H5_012433 [Mactra antiquata]